MLLLYYMFKEMEDRQGSTLMISYCKRVVSSVYRETYLRRCKYPAEHPSVHPSILATTANRQAQTKKKEKSRTLEYLLHRKKLYLI